MKNNCPKSVYQDLNKELTLTVQQLKMQISQLKSDNIHLNREMMKSKEENRLIRANVLNLINNTSLQFNNFVVKMSGGHLSVPKSVENVSLLTDITNKKRISVARIKPTPPLRLANEKSLSNQTNVQSDNEIEEEESFEDALATRNPFQRSALVRHSIEMIPVRALPPPEIDEENDERENVAPANDDLYQINEEDENNVTILGNNTSVRRVLTNSTRNTSTNNSNNSSSSSVTSNDRSSEYVNTDRRANRRANIIPQNHDQSTLIDVTNTDLDDSTPLNMTAMSGATSSTPMMKVTKRKAVNEISSDPTVEPMTNRLQDLSEEPLSKRRRKSLRNIKSPIVETSPVLNASGRPKRKAAPRKILADGNLRHKMRRPH